MVVRADVFFSAVPVLHLQDGARWFYENKKASQGNDKVVTALGELMQLLCKLGNEFGSC